MEKTDVVMEKTEFKEKIEGYDFTLDADAMCSS